MCTALHPLFAILLLLIAAPVAFANAIAPTVYFMPGVLPWMLSVAIPVSVLAAFLERPFVTWAGIHDNAIWYSLQANLVSLLIGYLTIPVGYYVLFTIGPLWSLIAVAMSVISEGCYYRVRCPEGKTVRWLPIVVGNVFSSLVIVFLPSLAMFIKIESSSLEQNLTPYQGTLLWGSVTGCVLLFFVSFLVTRLRETRKASPVP